jgi:hypothetical protein
MIAIHDGLPYEYDSLPTDHRAPDALAEPETNERQVCLSNQVLGARIRRLRFGSRMQNND